MNTQTMNRRVGTTQALDAPRGLPTESADAWSTWSAGAHPPSTLDRLAMRVGLALVLWSRHDHRARLSADDERERLALRNHAARDREAREQTWVLLASRLR